MIRFAILGAGHSHVESFIEEAAVNPEIRLVALYDKDPETLNRLTSRLSMPGFSDHHKLLSEVPVDAVLIAANYNQRPQLIIDSLNLGLKVAVDKPMATNLDDLNRIEQAVQASKGILSLVLEKRGYPVTLAVTQLFREGVLGEIKFVSSSSPHRLLPTNRPKWFLKREFYGGILGDLLTHDIDLALGFTNVKSGNVFANATTSSGKCRDDFQEIGAALFSSDDMKTIVMDAHWLSAEGAPYHGDYRMQLVGTEGTADMFWKDNILSIATHKHPPYTVALPLARRPLQDFFEAIRDQRSPEVSSKHSISVTRIALTAQLSADTATPQRWSI